MTDTQPLLYVTRRDVIEQKFWQYHKANPRVWEHFKHYAHEAIKAGKKRYSARAIIHRIRWHLDIEIKSQDEFFINDHHSPHYARLFMQHYPQYVRFFETRELISGKA